MSSTFNINVTIYRVNITMTIYPGFCCNLATFLCVYTMINEQMNPLMYKITMIIRNIGFSSANIYIIYSLSFIL